jgi:light-regulated signal transduction histidine kinase (bacteriophytochrome)
MGLLTVRDITERRKAEESLQASKEELERLLSEVQRSNQDLQQFAYVASHDLQEPLRMVSGFLELLERRYQHVLDEKAKAYIEHAVDGAKRMQSLIEGLLKYSRIAHAEFGWVDTSVTFADAIANLATAISESGAEVTGRELPTIWGDATQMLQLFQNLISNGIKYRKPDVPPRVNVSAERIKREWVFAMKDNGIGIDSHDFDRVFKIFQRLHTREEYPGTGIGLASCKKIVEQHGGRIWIESMPGEGSTFYFSLPATGAHAES